MEDQKDKTQLGSKPVKSTEEQIAELRSIKDREIQSWKDKHDQSEERLASLEDEILDLKARNADPEDVEEMRKNYVNLTRDNAKLKKEIEKAEGNIKGFERQGIRSQIAKEYGVNEELLVDCADVREMNLVAREERLKMVEAEPNVPGKDEVEVGAGIGSGAQRLALTSVQKIAEGRRLQAETKGIQ